MKQIRLEANPHLGSYLIYNLAVNPKLPFEGDSFDACTLTVSVQYYADSIRALYFLSNFSISGNRASS